jgi:hypothetical protein
MLKLSVSKPYECQFCKSKFMQEKTLAVHLCEQKRRYLAKDNKATVIGYQTFNRFFQITQKLGQNKTYDEFARSPYYNAFVKFGSYVSNVNPLYPEKYIEWIVRSGVKLDHWCRDELYEKYVLDLIKTETVETALQRSINHMMAWSDTHNSQWNHYFLYVSLNRASFDIRDGKISPWILLNSKNGKEMLSKFSDEQLEAVGPTIDPQFWMKKFKSLPADVELVRQVIKESNI